MSRVRSVWAVPRGRLLAWRVWRDPLLPYLVVVGLVLVFTNLYPLLRLLQRALFTADGVTLENVAWLLSPRVRTALGNSVTVSVSATGLALGVGLLLALLTTKTDLPGRGFVRLAFLAPLVIPPQILAIAWLQWAGPVGYVQNGLRALSGLEGRLWSLYGPGGIVLLLTLFTLPITTLTLGAGLGRVPRELEEAARLDGANEPQVWRFVVLPLLVPHLTAATVLGFLGALGNFGIPALLAIPARYATLPTLLYQEVVRLGVAGFGRSAALALLFGLPALVTLWLQGRVLRRSESRALDLSGPVATPTRLGVWRWPLAVLFGLLTLVAVVGPLFAVVSTGLLRAYGLPLRWENLTLNHFRFVLTGLEPARRAALHSLALASGAALLGTALALVIGYAATRREGRWARGLRLLIDLPYALPGLIFALSLILVWLPSPIPGMSLYGTLWLLLVAYLGRFLAFALQPIEAAWRQLDMSLEEAASIDGASLTQTFRHILLPLMAPSLGVAVLLVFLQAFAELTLSALLAGSRTETLGWLVFGLEQAGSSNQAAALSSLLLALLFAVAGFAALRRRVAQRYWT